MISSAQSVQVSTYCKPELIRLAKATGFVDLPTDPDFESTLCYNNPVRSSSFQFQTGL